MRVVVGIDFSQSSIGFKSQWNFNFDVEIGIQF